MILQTRDLIIERGKTVRLAFDDLSVERGDSVLFLGASGSGKTTLLSMIAGLLTPTNGTVLLNGENLYAMPSEQIDQKRGQNFGFIFQTLHLLPSLTIRGNILLAAKMSGASIDHGRVDTLLESLGLQNKPECKPHELSQGEKQRAAIARAVFNRPPILIADEPTSALDDHNARITIDLIRQQAKEAGSALILATHDNRITTGFDKTIRLNSGLAEAA